VLPEAVVVRNVKQAIHIRSFTGADYDACTSIYKAGLDTGIATFETEVPDWETWNVKFLKACRFVAEDKGDIMGWCALTPYSFRAVYQGVAEVSIYIASAFQGKGVGKALLLHLISESKKSGFWTLQANIFPQNEASIRLHERCGFKILGVREKIGKRLGIWYDNVLLERRSTVL